MARLMALPREIRDAITDLVIRTTTRVVQQHDSDAAKSRILSRSTAVNGKDVEQHRPGTIGYALYNAIHDNVLYPSEETAYRPNALGLLLANRQLHEETNERLMKLPVECTLQVDLVHETKLWPTFTSIPVRTVLDMDKVDIDLCLGLPSPNGESGFGGKAPIWTGIVEIIMRFLKVGPTHPSSERSQDDGTCVKNLTLNCAVPLSFPKGFELAPKGLPVYREMWSRFIQSGDQYWALQGLPKPVIESGKMYIMRPEALADYIHTSLRSLLFGVGQFSTMLFQRIGELHIRVYGEQHTDANLKGCLSIKAQLLRDDGLREGQQYEWLKETVRLRRERGLPIPDIGAQFEL
ncbi:hypothetical protein BDV96DRAFT_649947 [Lophiotrema nucula]|uniref:Uncharacterized protein n=1 Tax=Lophiotrema nucula TaxID=690887 RepID=A0A6A5YWQ9_9PLEO|nr:hypothetical protein BDV96DRAFT_649947 [Lophiotrema nucula]